MTYTVVGLGNPGKEYENTRHNIGRMAVSKFASSLDLDSFSPDKMSNSLKVSGEIGSKKVNLILPETFMNKSGLSVAKFVKNKKQAESLIVVHDDIDLPLGKIRISFARGSAGNKGVLSIERQIKTKDFIRIRIGVCPQTKTGKIKKPNKEKVNSFVIGKFRAGEKDEVKKILKKVSDALECIIKEDYLKASNKFN